MSIFIKTEAPHNTRCQAYICKVTTNLYCDNLAKYNLTCYKDTLTIYMHRNRSLLTRPIRIFGNIGYGAEASIKR